LQTSWKGNFTRTETKPSHRRKNESADLEVLEPVLQLNQIKQLAHTDGILKVARQPLVPEETKATEDGGALNEKSQ